MVVCSVIICLPCEKMPVCLAKPLGNTGTPSHVVCLASSLHVFLGSGGELHAQCWDFGTRDMGGGHSPSAELGTAGGRRRAVWIWGEGGDG